MKISVIFDVDFDESIDFTDAQRADHFVQYLFDMLYIGCDGGDAEIFKVRDASIHLYPILNVKQIS